MTNDTRSKLKPFIDAAATMNRIPAQPEGIKDAVSQNIKIPVMSPTMQEAIANLSKISVPPIPKMPEPLKPSFSEIGDTLTDSIIKREQFEREAQAQAVADAMSDVIKEIMEDQNKLAETTLEKEHDFQTRQTWKTIIGSGICAAAATLLTTWLMS